MCPPNEQPLGMVFHPWKHPAGEFEAEVDGPEKRSRTERMQFERLRAILNELNEQSRLTLKRPEQNDHVSFARPLGRAR